MTSPSPDPVLPPVFTRREPRAAGKSKEQISQRIRSGRWASLRWGAFCRREDLPPRDRRRRHQLESMAAMLAQRRHDPDAAPSSDDAAGHDATDATPRLAISHLSAACFYGWPRPWRGWGAPHLTAQPSTGHPRRRAGMVVQAAALGQDDVRVVQGVVVTSPHRTVTDLLRHLPPAEAVAIADHALREGDARFEDVVAALGRQSGWPFVAKARRCLALVDPRRETWLESWSFVSLHMRGVPLPVPQAQIFDGSGRFVARVDGYWPDAGLVGEADGAVKYDLTGPYVDRRAATPDGVIAWGQRRLDQQRRRHDRLLELGLQVVRWSATDISSDLPALAQRLTDRLEAGARATFTGHVVLPPALPWANPSPIPARFTPEVHAPTSDMPQSHPALRA
jgi:hypothetical protein